MTGGDLPSLAGIRVVDIAGIEGAYGSKLLADLGADVILVEPPGGHAGRRMPPLAPAGDESLWFAAFATSKRSVTLDLAGQSGRDVFRRMVATADVVYDTSRPGQLEALGVGWVDLSPDNPGLSWVSLTPYGRSGPRRSWRGSNLVGWASSGILITIGDPDRSPVVPGGPALLGYAIASLNAAAGALLAVRARALTGRGQMVDVSVQESLVAIAPEVGVPVYLDDLLARTRPGNRRPLVRPWGLYPCEDGWISILVLQPHHWVNFARWAHEVTGNDVVTDPAFNDLFTRMEAIEVIDEWTEELTSRYTRREFFEEGQRRGVPVTPVMSAADLAADPHLEARGYWVTVDDVRGNPRRLAGPPYRLSRTPWTARRAPFLGEHNEEVLSALS